MLVHIRPLIVLLPRTTISQQSKRCFVRKLLNSIKDTTANAKEEHKTNFQNWAEFENRGFRRPEYMRAWIIDEYGSPENVLQLETLDTPSNKYKSDVDSRRSYLYQAVQHPNDVLVKVHAASLNPIDIRISEGYGASLFNFQRDAVFDSVRMFLTPFRSVQKDYSSREFPLILGRDFSGTIVDVGTQVFDLQPGDEVYGAPSLFRQGVLSDYACVDLSEVVQRPATCSHIEAASIPYVGLTVASSLRDIVSKPVKPKRALILGGSGGVGTFAIQYLQAYGYIVTVTCSSEGLKICNRLGAECINYEVNDVDAVVRSSDKFGIVFDPIGAASPEWASKCLVKGGTFITLRSPLVELSDKYGPVVGLSNAAAMYAKKKLENLNINVQWGFFKLNRGVLLEIARLVDSGLIKPVVDVNNIYNFDNVPKAFKSLASGHTKGKIIINVSGLPEAVHKPPVEKVVHL